MRFPSIAITIPTYNEEKNIRRCLDSIYKQQYTGKLEVFIVDGGSTDLTLKYAKKYPVTILKNPFKQAEYGKKIGLMKSTSKYFMILDCDMGLVGKHWFEKMVKPLEEDKRIFGTWAGFVSVSTDAPLNKYISLDCIQRDPLFEWLTPSIKSRLTERKSGYWLLTYEQNKILPAGFCLYRKNELLQTEVKNMKKYMELDTLSIYVKRGWNTFAYIPTIGLHHPFLTNLRNLLRKRIRNLETMYFNQPDTRYWTWIDWSNKKEYLKIILWILYCYTIIPSIAVGIYKSIKHKSFVGLYELPFNVLSTSVIIKSFLKSSEGRNLIRKFIS